MSQSSPLPDDYAKWPRNRTSSPTPRLFSLPRMSLFTPGGSYVCVRRRQARKGAAGLLARERRHHPQPTSNLVPTRPCSGRRQSAPITSASRTLPAPAPERAHQGRRPSTTTGIPDTRPARPSDHLRAPAIGLFPGARERRPGLPSSIPGGRGSSETPRPLADAVRCQRSWVNVNQYTMGSSPCGFSPAWAELDLGRLAAPFEGPRASERALVGRSRSMELGLFEPPQLRRRSATCGNRDRK